MYKVEKHHRSTTHWDISRCWHCVTRMSSFLIRKFLCFCKPNKKIWFWYSLHLDKRYGSKRKKHRAFWLFFEMFASQKLYSTLWELRIYFSWILARIYQVMKFPIDDGMVHQGLRLRPQGREKSKRSLWREPVWESWVFGEWNHRNLFRWSTGIVQVFFIFISMPWYRHRPLHLSVYSGSFDLYGFNLNSRIKSNRKLWTTVVAHVSDYDRFSSLFHPSETKRNRSVSECD